MPNANEATRCPHCGACKHCGAPSYPAFPGYWSWPYRPFWIVPQVPFVYPTITYTSLGSAPTTTTTY